MIAATLDIRNLSRSRTPVFPYKRVVEMLAPGWDISLAFVPPKRAAGLNKKLRQKTYEPNVLSYVTGTKSGEIIICPIVAKREAPEYGMRYPTFVGFLFIHGILHLIGMRHGSTMEKAERQALARFAPITTHGSSNRNRNRHRITSSKGRRP